MIKYACPKCLEPLQAPNERLGAIHPCPKCGGQVQVPVPQSNKLPWILLSVLGGAVGLGFCCIFSLAAIQVMGTNANKTFGTVGASLGPVTGGK